MTRFTDHTHLAVAQDARPDVAHLLISAAKELGCDHQDPVVLASTSEGFRVRGDVLGASGLDQPGPGGSEPGPAVDAATASAGQVAAPADTAPPAPQGKGAGAKPGKSAARKE